MWNHRHDSPDDVHGHALLENRAEGVYAYCTFNNSENGQLCNILVQHGDIKALSIYANQLKQQGGNVMHGEIREVSLVHAGANPGATITSVIAHSDDGEPIALEDECIIHTGEDFSLYHADEKTEKEEDKSMAETKEKSTEKTVEEVFNELTDEQKTVVYAMIGQALEHGGSDDEENEEKEVNEENVEHSEGGENSMKHNVFENDEMEKSGVLSHADQEKILKMAQQSNVGSFQQALANFSEENSLAHGFDEEDLDLLFPDYKDVRPGAPELIERDQTWVGEVIRKIHKSPISRIRTRQMDARGDQLRAHGYKNKGDEKTLSGNPKLMQRTTDPQTVYRKDMLHRDDIIDMTEFSIVDYLYTIMKHNLYEDLALAAMVGDLREDGDPDKINEEHIRPIWKDDELYTIHQDVDIEAARAELQGTDTNVHFGENYIYAEALITASLYSREQYKGSGNLEFYCTPHLLNVMLLARDLNGRRIYDSKADLAKALNVSAIHTAEQFEGLTRTTKEGAKKELLGLFVNLSDYQFGSTKGGEITKFEDFDIDFNQHKYLIETRLSGALTRIKSAIALEKPVTAVAG